MPIFNRTVVDSNVCTHGFVAVCTTHGVVSINFWSSEITQEAADEHQENHHSNIFTKLFKR